MSGKPTASELRYAGDWFDAATGERPANPPFSFRYDGADSRSFLGSWEFEREDVPESEGVVARALTYRDSATGLVCSCETTAYPDFPAVDWLVRFTNDGQQDTPIISDVQVLDASFPFVDEPVRVHGANGSLCRADDFAPTETILQYPKPHRIGPEGGRSSSGVLPLFNVEYDGRGVIGAVGWTGNWDAQFELTDDRHTRLRAGMREVHLSLRPGESIRMPRMLLLFWEGDRLHGHNMLRQLIISKYSPALMEPSPGAPHEPPTSFAVWGENTAERQLAKARWMAENDIAIDNFWIDAGWHGDVVKTDKPNVFNTAWGDHVGNWWPNKSYYPDGLGAIGDLASENGMRFTLWFDTERVFKGTYFVREHPEWLLGPIGDYYLFNLGDPGARAGITDVISSVIAENNVTLYRQDFNMDPEAYWRSADAPDRVGMSEIRHIEGLYAFWDELLERHPGLIIDNCASGGRRIDLESISRSIALWRSDMQCFRGFDPIGMQSQTHGLSMWVPFSTGCCDRPETYAFRSSILPGVVMAPPAAEPDEPEGYKTPWDAFSVDWLRRATHEQREVRKYATGDFYPLTSFGLADDLWAVWQFDRLDLGEGVVIALRRQKSPHPRMEARLRGIDAEAEYEVYSFDDDATTTCTGSELTGAGLAIEIDDPPGSRMYRYRRT